MSSMWRQIIYAIIDYHVNYEGLLDSFYVNKVEIYDSNPCDINGDVQFMSFNMFKSHPFFISPRVHVSIFIEIQLHGAPERTIIYGDVTAAFWTGMSSSLSNMIGTV